MDLVKEAQLNTKRKHPFIFKFFSLFSVVRLYNIMVVLLAQLLSAIFIFSPDKELHKVIFDYRLWLIMLSTAAVIASGYIINHFYDKGKDAVNRPIKTKIDDYISQSTKLKSYFILNFLGFGLGLLISLRAGLFFAVYIFLIWFYSHKLKRYPLAGFLLSAFLSILPFFAVFAYYKNFSEIIFVHATFLFFLLLIKELIKDLENLKGDMLYNYQTIVTYYGEHFTRMLITLIIVLAVLPVYFILQYPETGAMKYYFVFAVAGLSFIGLFVWFSSRKEHYVLLHNLIKLIIIVGVFSLILVDKSVIIEKIISRI